MHNVMQKLTRGIHRFFHSVSGGRLGRTMRGAPVLFLTTTGNKTGKKHVTPLLYLRDGDTIVIVASNGGYQKHPGWYHNLRVDPTARVKVDGQEFAVRAEVATPEEKARVWNPLVAMYKGYANYQQKTSRDIPVVFLHRAS